MIGDLVVHVAEAGVGERGPGAEATRARVPRRGVHLVIALVIALIAAVST